MNRFDKAKFHLYCGGYEYVKPVLKCLKQGMRVVVVGHDNCERAVEDFPELKITRE